MNFSSIYYCNFPQLKAHLRQKGESKTITTAVFTVGTYLSANIRDGLKDHYIEGYTIRGRATQEFTVYNIFDLCTYINW